MERFKITDMSGLSWAFKKLSELQKQKEEKQQLAKIEHERVDEWLSKETKTIDDSISYFQGLIQEYHMKNPTKKTLSTPYGKSKARQTAATIEKKDDNALLKYVYDNHLDNYLKHSVRWNELKKSLSIVGDQVINEDGEIVPGVAIKPAHVSYSVEV